MNFNYFPWAVANLVSFRSKSPKHSKHAEYFNIGWPLLKVRTDLQKRLLRTPDSTHFINQCGLYCNDNTIPDDCSISYFK